MKKFKFFIDIEKEEQWLNEQTLAERRSTRIIKEKIFEIEDTQKKLEHSKQDLYEILKLDITCEKGFGKH